MRTIRIYRLIETGELFVKTDAHYMDAIDFFNDGGQAYSFNAEELEFMNAFDFRTEADKAEEFIYSDN